MNHEKFLTRVLPVFAVLAALLLAPACDKVFSTQGTVSLTIIDKQTGTRKAFVSVELVPVTEGSEDDRNEIQKSVDDNGTVIFKEVPPGEWQIRVKTSTGKLLQVDQDTFTLQSGRTQRLEITAGEPQETGGEDESQSGGGMGF